MTNDYIIRLEREEDHATVENLVRESFWNVYAPGCSEHLLLHNLRNAKDFIPELNFVMETNNVIIGQNVFCKTKIDCDDGKSLPILTMGPICITPTLKRQGYGKVLLDYTLQKATEMGFGAVCFEGNYAFYSKCGFDFAKNFGLRYAGLPENADSSFFLCKELIPNYLKGITGVYTSPECYHVDEKQLEEYDKKFVPKQKLKLPGQLV